MKNGFFQLVHKADGTYLRLIPPQGGGQPLSVDELMEYLNERQIAYNLKELNDAVGSLGAEKVILLNHETIYPHGENYSLYISADKMLAVARFYAPSLGAEELKPEELKAELEAKNIQYGIRTENIEAFFRDRRYCEDVVVAEGEPYEPGKAGTVEYAFAANRKAKPMLREDGSVDFHQLNTICPCKKGDLLARLVPTVQGKPGRNIYGNEVSAPLIKEVRLQYGKNISISEDFLSIYSEVNGHVTLINGEVFVTDLLQLENVDVSTGNVEYDGGILINGNVGSGFTVKATGDIEIKGVVEGARVESGGNISIARGMNGMSKGVLAAKGHIVCKFIENAEVFAGGYITAEAILHSKVQSETEIEVTGKKGFITGGKVMASNKITVKMLGSAMGAATTVAVGISPELKRRQTDLLASRKDILKELATIEPVIMAVIQKNQKNIALSDAQMKNVQQLAIVRQQKKKELEQIGKELEELEEVLLESENPCVDVSGEVYPGTKICISDVSLIVKTNTKYCRFIRAEGDVKMTTFQGA